MPKWDAGGHRQNARHVLHARQHSFFPFDLAGDGYSAYYGSLIFQPDLTNPNSPGFTISAPLSSPYYPNLFTTNAKDGFDFGIWFAFDFVAQLPCSGFVCEDAFSPAITALTVGATGYAADVGPQAGGWAIASDGIWANEGLCAGQTFPFEASASAGEQLNGSYANLTQIFGPSNSAAFQCPARIIEGALGAGVQVTQVAPSNPFQSSTASLGSASFYSGRGASTPLPNLAPFATPEPSSLLPLGSGLLGLMGMGLYRTRLA